MSQTTLSRYDALCREFPLRPIRDEAQNDRAIVRISTGSQITHLSSQTKNTTTLRFSRYWFTSLTWLITHGTGLRAWI